MNLPNVHFQSCKLVFQRSLTYLLYWLQTSHLGIHCPMLLVLFIWHFPFLLYHPGTTIMFYWHSTWVSTTLPKGLQIQYNQLTFSPERLSRWWKSSPCVTILLFNLWELEWPMELVFLGLRDFPGCGTFFAKSKKCQANQDELATLSGTPLKMLLPGFSKTLRTHCKHFLLPFLDREDKERHNRYVVESSCPWEDDVTMVSPWKKMESLLPLMMFLLLIWSSGTTCFSKAFLLFGSKWYGFCVTLYFSPWSSLLDKQCRYE